MNGIDYAWARPGAANIKAKGYGFVCRYLSHDSSKNLTVSEVLDLHNNGIAIVVVWESTANRALDGNQAGIDDANAAISQSHDIGLPTDRPIYFAVDFDATPAQQVNIDSYLKGVANVIGIERIGVYGGFYVVQRCLNNNTAKWAWQTLAWSGGQQEPRNHIYQTGGTDFNGGADIDESKQTDYGQWPLNGGEYMVNQDLLNAYYQDLLGRPVDPQGEGYLGQDDIVVYNAIRTSGEATARSAHIQSQLDTIPGLQGQITTLQVNNASLAGQIDNLNKQIVTLKQQLANQAAPTPPVIVNDPNSNNPLYKFFKALGVFK